MKRGRDRKAREALAERKNYSEEKNKRERIYPEEKSRHKMKDVGKSKVYGKTLTAEYGNTINGEEKEELNDKSLMNRAAILRGDDRHASRGL